MEQQRIELNLRGVAHISMCRFHHAPLTLNPVSAEVFELAAPLDFGPNLVVHHHQSRFDDGVSACNLRSRRRLAMLTQKQRTFELGKRMIQEVLKC